RSLSPPACRSDFSQVGIPVTSSESTVRLNNALLRVRHAYGNAFGGLAQIVSEWAIQKSACYFFSPTGLPLLPYIKRRPRPDTQSHHSRSRPESALICRPGR